VLITVTGIYQQICPPQNLKVCTPRTEKQLLLTQFKNIIMVTVASYAVRETKDGRSFICLELSGSLELVQSQQTGKFYATTKRCSLPCTFDENTAKLLVGTQMQGEIVKRETEPYEFINKNTGETMMLDYTYEYQGSVGIELPGTIKLVESEIA